LIVLIGEAGIVAAHEIAAQPLRALGVDRSYSGSTTRKNAGVGSTTVAS
jgi:hypothetical protein